MAPALQQTAPMKPSPTARPEDEALDESRVAINGPAASLSSQPIGAKEFSANGQAMFDRVVTGSAPAGPPRLTARAAAIWVIPLVLLVCLAAILLVGLSRQSEDSGRVRDPLGEAAPNAPLLDKRR